MREVIETKGLFCSLYSDRGSHFFVTVKAGEKVDKQRLTQVGRAMKELGVQMIRSLFSAGPGPIGAKLRDLARAAAARVAAGGESTKVEGANVFLRERYMAEFNGKFTRCSASKRERPFAGR